MKKPKGKKSVASKLQSGLRRFQQSVEDLVAQFSPEELDDFLDSFGAVAGGESAVEYFSRYLDLCAHDIVLATRNGRTHNAFALQFKPVGLTEIIVMRDIGKSAADEMLRRMDSSLPSFDMNLAGAVKMIEVALAANLVSGTPPPYELVQLAELLGIGELTPKSETTQQLIDDLIADASPLMTYDVAVQHAHRRISESEFAQGWFEAGEAVEDLIAPLSGAKRREDGLLKNFLPARRDYWARNCALSAFAMSQAPGKRSPYLYDLALVGRDLLSSKPTDNLPILQRIAATSVEAFQDSEGRR